MTKSARWVFGIVAGVVGVAYGIALGVPGGDHLRMQGEGFIGEAEQLWLEIFVVLSIVFAIPRSTRWASVALTGGYILALGLGYLAGYHFGNFVGWHPD